MAKIDPQHERQRLAEFYSRQTDGELEKVAQQGYELTDLARDALREELVKRGLYVGQLEQLLPKAENRAEFRDLVTVRTFLNPTEAELAKGLLEAAGIESFLFDDNMGRMYWMNAVGGVKLRVDASNAEAASRLLEEDTSSDAAADPPELPDDDPST
jgi:hypothetical protein